MIHPSKLLTSSILGIGLFGFGASAEPIFRWVDNAGTVHCTGEALEVPAGRTAETTEDGIGCITVTDSASQPANHAEVPFHAYRWVDDQGVTNYTDNPDNIPPKFKVDITFGADIGRDAPKAEPKS